MRGMLPKKLVMSLGDGTFSTKTKTDNWRTISSEYFSTVELFLHGKEEERIKDKCFYKLNKLYQLCSPQYFHVSFFDMIKGNNYQYYPTAKPFLLDVSSKLSDGSINYNVSVRNRSIDQTRTMAMIAAAKINNEQAKYSISLEVREKFEAFISQILSDGVSIVFFLPPYHPKYFELYMYKTDKLDKIEQYVHRFAEQKGIKVLGSYDPSKAACCEEDFFDEVHLKERGIRKIFLGFSSARKEIQIIK